METNPPDAQPDPEQPALQLLQDYVFKNRRIGSDLLELEPGEGGILIGAFFTESTVAKPDGEEEQFHDLELFSMGSLPTFAVGSRQFGQLVLDEAKRQGNVTQLEEDYVARVVDHLAKNPGGLPERVRSGAPTTFYLVRLVVSRDNVARLAYSRAFFGALEAIALVQTYLDRGEQEGQAEITFKASKAAYGSVLQEMQQQAEALRVARETASRGMAPRPMFDPRRRR